MNNCLCDFFILCNKTLLVKILLNSVANFVLAADCLSLLSFQFVPLILWLFRRQSILPEKFDKYCKDLNEIKMDEYQQAASELVIFRNLELKGQVTIK